MNPTSSTLATPADELLARAVLRVGDGRGFVVEHRNYHGTKERIIITAAHCLPGDLPPPHPARYLKEETYQALLGPLGGEQIVWAHCRFVDPIADVAVLGVPDNQALSDQADTYDALVESMTVLPVADAPVMGVEIRNLGGFGYARTKDPDGVERLHITARDDDVERSEVKVPTAGEGPARVLSLEGQWRDGRVARRGMRLAFEPESAFVGGMSGSPIINADGAAIGVVSVESMSPVLVDSLPGWLLRTIRRARRRRAR